MYGIHDQKFETHHQLQNPAEISIYEVKTRTVSLLNYTNLWLQCFLYVVNISKLTLRESIRVKFLIEVATGQLKDLCFHMI
jgi:hypothetical protein